MTPASNPFGSSLLISFHSNAGGGAGRGTEGLIHSSFPTPNQQALATMFAQQIEQFLANLAETLHPSCLLHLGDIHLVGIVCAAVPLDFL